MVEIRCVLSCAQDEIDSIGYEREVQGRAIHSFLRLLERRSRFSNHLPNVWAFDIQFFYDWNEGKFLRTKGRIKNVNIFKEDILFFPVHLPSFTPNGNWALISVFLKEKKIGLWIRYIQICLKKQIV